MQILHGRAFNPCVLLTVQIASLKQIAKLASQN
jgi:hypothetical protein